MLFLAKESQSLSLEGQALLSIVGTYLFLGEPQKVIEFAQPALEIAQKTKNRQLEGSILSLLGWFYSQLLVFYQSKQHLGTANPCYCEGFEFFGSFWI